MEALRLALFFVSVGIHLYSAVAEKICISYTRSPQALRDYCTIVGGTTYRSPACSVYRICDSNGITTPQFGAALCSADRLFVTLCADRPDLPECTTFRRRLMSSAAGSTHCAPPTALKLWSTDAVVTTVAALCSSARGRSASALVACSRCDAAKCDTADPLAAYASLCTESPTAVGCKPWAEFCAEETPAAAPALCLPPSSTAAAAAGDVGRAGAVLRRTGTVGAHSPAPPPPPADPCVLDSTQPSCKSYTYPDSAALANINQLCGSMPDMPGCAIARACESEQPGVAAKYCRPFVLLATLCHDMPGMRGCEAYKALCSREGSVVEQCVVQGPVPRAPTWSQARKAVFGACGDHPMAGCASCTSTDCPDPLASLADICHEMPEMAACGTFWAFCEAAGPQDMAEWCAEDDDKYLPSMLMYFHQRTQELVLWKEWRPRTRDQYIASVIAIVAMGVVATGLKTAKGALVLQWNHQRALSGQEPPRVVSVWALRSGQTAEILIKSAITGVSLTLDYFNMLIAMTFNVGFFCAVIAGYIVGSLLFSHVLENYAALLHQQRRDTAAQVKRLRAPHAILVNGSTGAGGAGTVLAYGNSGVVGVGIAGGAVGGAGVTLASRGTSEQEEEDAEEEEEKLLMAVEGEGECNCVHSA